VGDALRHSGRQMREQDAGPMSQVPDKAADQIDKLSEYLSSKSVDELVADVEEFGRQNPVLFVGGAFAVGVLAARFLKSAPQPAQSGGYPAGYSPVNTPYRYDPRLETLTNHPVWEGGTPEVSDGA
jgi:hypothetical protein